MTTLSHALALASKGFHVFPCEENGKLPVIKDFPNRATRDADQITKWFDGTNRNIGISTTRFGDDQALCVVDVDVKGDKHGDQTILQLELAGNEFPVTLEQSTPSGGRHMVYTTPDALRQGVAVLGDGVDIRSRGGYIVGPGSTIDGKAYAQINGHGALAGAPAWLVDRLGADRRDRTGARAPLVGVDPDRAEQRALTYLAFAPLALEGDGGDLTTYRVAAKLKDLGCTEDQAWNLMGDHWNDRCSPPWSEDELADKIHNAYRYGNEAPGIDAPEAVFPPLPQPDPDSDAPEARHPFAHINDAYALVKAGAFILHETTDSKGAYTTQHMSIPEFHAWHANQPFTQGTETKAISKWWMGWGNRRQYEGVVFQPEQDAGPRFFNLWRGFRVAPAATYDHPAVTAFMEHALRNVCGGDPELFRWLIGYFAHLIQRPYEKPLVACVFQGEKGVGKNALVERVAWLLGSHALVADDDRYLLSNFNAHLESNLLFILDEASWAGDKKAEGRLKGLITGTTHNIERKGKEPYQVANLTRVFIIGNEDWLVPASTDERRFAVFSVGEGRKQDRNFFQAMREGMEQGGYAHLLRCLLDFDLSQVDVNQAPNNKALTNQKLATLEPIADWWHDCLAAGRIVGNDLFEDIPDRINTNRMREAYASWARQRHIRSRLESDDAFGKKFKKMARSSTKKRRGGKGETGDSTYDYHLPHLDTLRSDFQAHINGEIEWPTPD